jgi:DNA-binding SARP family transcriptional activator
MHAIYRSVWGENLTIMGASFRIMGRLAVLLDGDSLPPPRPPVLQGLLGALLLARGEPLATERLARLVWAERAPSTSRESVHMGISRLRKWLKRQDGLGPDEFVIDYVDGYLLRGIAGRVDLCQFSELTGRARSLAAPDERSRTLRAAWDLRHGPLLDGMTHLDRSDALVRRAEREIRDAVMDLAGAALLTDKPQIALAAVDEMAEEHPFDEPLHAARIDVLAASGRPAEALQAYQTLRERLARELGVEPSEEVQAAHLRALSGTYYVARQARIAGIYVPQVLVPAQLPPDISDFTGRDDEVAMLTARLVGVGESRPRGMPIATVVGMKGLGKTTLAVHVAHRVALRFPAGQLYADLRGDSPSPAEPAEVLGMFLRALGIRDSSVPGSAEERMALFRSRVAGRKVLVVLDNAANEEQARQLLPGTSDAAVLITNRHGLVGLEGATTLKLDVFTPAQAVDLLGAIAGKGRVAAEPESAMEITRLCGHVPLAIRSAAARLLSSPQWTLAQFVDVLREERRRLDE